MQPVRAARRLDRRDERGGHDEQLATSSTQDAESLASGARELRGRSALRRQRWAHELLLVAGSDRLEGIAVGELLVAGRQSG